MCISSAYPGMTQFRVSGFSAPPQMALIVTVLGRQESLD